jgi:hypothetical protein
MTYLIVLGALALLPIVLIAALRANAAICFMGLCVGSVLVNYTSSDVTTFVTSFSPAKSVLDTNQWVQLALLTAPFLLTLFFTRKSVKGSKQLFNMLPAISAGLLFALLAIPLLAASLQRSIKDQPLYHQLSNLQTLIVFAGALLSLMFILSTHRALRKAEGKHSKHKH